MAGPSHSRRGKHIRRLFRVSHLDQQQDRYSSVGVMILCAALTSQIIHESVLCNHDLIILKCYLEMMSRCLGIVLLCQQTNLFPDHKLIISLSPDM